MYQLMCNADINYWTHFDAMQKFDISDVLICGFRFYGFVQYVVDVVYEWTDVYYLTQWADYKQQGL